MTAPADRLTDEDRAAFEDAFILGGFQYSESAKNNARGWFCHGYAVGLAEGVRRERERCAKICEVRAKGAPSAYATEAQLCAAAIRAGEEKNMTSPLR